MNARAITAGLTASAIILVAVALGLPMILWCVITLFSLLLAPALYFVHHGHPFVGLVVALGEILVLDHIGTLFKQYRYSHTS